MTIRAGQFVTFGNNILIDRIQTGGVNNVNIPEEKIHELGNFQTVGTVYDIPDLTFEIESLDVSTDIEAMLNGLDPTTITDGELISFDNARPLNVVSPFRAGNFLYNIVRGIAVPWLNLEQVTYRYGVRANATETFTLRGDAIYYIPGTPWVDQVAGGSTAYTFINGPALPMQEHGETIHALGVDWIDLTTGLYQRLFFGEDYTDDATGITIVNAAKAPPATAQLRIMYGSLVADTVPQSANTPASVKPAAVRAQNLDVYIAPNSATPAYARFTGVQSVEVNRRVNLEQTQEFGNTHNISSDWDTADVNGQLMVRSNDPTDLWNKVAELASQDPTQVTSPIPTIPVYMEIHVNHPVTGARLKTLRVPDAIFTIPPASGRQQQKLETTWRWESQTGILEVFKGTATGLTSRLLGQGAIGSGSIGQ